MEWWTAGLGLPAPTPPESGAPTPKLGLLAGMFGLEPTDPLLAGLRATHRQCPLEEPEAFYSCPRRGGGQGAES